MVKQYVDNVFVKPTPSDAGFFIVDESKAIVTRMMNYVTSVKTYDEWVDCAIGAGEMVEHTATWCIVNPFTHMRENPISEMHLFSYPLAIAAQNVNGIDYVNNVPTAFVSDVYDFTTVSGSLCRPWYNGIAVGSLEPFWTEIGSFSTYDASVGYGVTFCPFNGLFNSPCTVYFGNIETTQYPQLRMNAYLCMLIATTSGTWDQYHVNLMSDDFNKGQIFDLVYSSLHGNAPDRSASFYENLLSAMPCQGPFNNDWTNTIGSDESWPWNTTNYWPQGIPQGDPYDGSLGEYNGIDWMLLYNLYRLHFSTGYESYNDVSCPCDGSNAKIDLNIDANNNLISDVALLRKFPQYTSFDIKLKEHLSHDLQLTNGYDLNNNTDLIVCNNSVVDVDAGSVIAANSSATDEASFVFRKGTTLHL